MAYGVDASRYQENKRAVEDKYIGALVKTIMTRCIHCTRCIRFATEVAGVPELGAIGRGEDMEITTYLEQAMTSELQGNVVDLCPVGALTSKPYAFAARPWELNKTESIDVMDALGSAIRIDTRGREVMRILPRVNDDVNEEWISDKTRHVVDGLRTQRLDQPYIREDGRLRPATWPAAFDAIAAKVKRHAPERIGAIVGDLAAVEEIFALKDLMTRLGVDQSRLPAGRLGARSGLGPRELSVQRDHRRHRAGRCAADRRRQSAPGSGGAQRAHPQALARRQLSDRPDRRARRPHLSLRLSRRRARRPWPSSRPARIAFADVLKDAAAPADHPRRRARWRGPTARRSRRWRPRPRRPSAPSRTAGTASRCCTPRPRASARSTSASCRATGGLNAAEMAGTGAPRRRVPARRRRDRGRARRLRRLSRHPRRPRRAPRRRHPAGRRLSGEIRHLRQHRRPRADGGARRRSRPARRARTGRSCARCPTCSATGCPTTRSRSCARRCSRRIRICSASTRSRPATPATSRKLATLGGTPDKAPFAPPIDDFYLTNPIARASAVMAECSALAEGSAALTAAE